MKRTAAEKLLTYDYNSMSLEELQKFRVKILDAWRESQAEYGETQAVRDGYYAIVASESASGYVPVNLWLTQNLDQRFLQVEKRLQQICI